MFSGNGTGPGYSGTRPIRSLSSPDFSKKMMSRILHVWRPSNIRLTHAQYARSPGHVPQSQSPWCHGSVTVMPTGNTSPSFQTTPPPLLPRMASSSSPSSSTTRLVKFTQRPRSHPPSSSTEPVCYSVHWPSLAHVVLVPPKDLHFPRSIREHLISMQPSFHAPSLFPRHLSIHSLSHTTTAPIITPVSHTITHPIPNPTPIQSAHLSQSLPRIPSIP